MNSECTPFFNDIMQIKSTSARCQPATMSDCAWNIRIVDCYNISSLHLKVSCTLSAKGVQTVTYWKPSQERGITPRNTNIEIGVHTD